MNRRHIISSIASNLHLHLSHQSHAYGRMINPSTPHTTLCALCNRTSSRSHVGRCPATYGPVLSLGGFGAFAADCVGLWSR